jgi:hypothetical protein
MLWSVAWFVGVDLLVCVLVDEDDSDALSAAAVEVTVVFVGPVSFVPETGGGGAERDVEEEEADA